MVPVDNKFKEDYDEAYDVRISHNHLIKTHGLDSTWHREDTESLLVLSIYSLAMNSPLPTHFYVRTINFQ